MRVTEEENRIAAERIAAARGVTIGMAFSGLFWAFMALAVAFLIA